jgi:hypothetical protein
MRKPVNVEAHPGGGVSKESFGPWLKDCPTLVDFLVDESWDDGAARRTGTILLLTEDAMIKAWLHDRDGPGRAIWVSGTTLGALLKAAEKALSTNAGWRADKDAGRRGR